MKTGVGIAIGFVVLLVCAGIIVGALGIAGVFNKKSPPSSSSGTPSGAPSPRTPSAYSGPSYASTQPPPPPPPTTPPPPPPTTPPPPPPTTPPPPSALSNNIALTPLSSPEAGCPPGQTYYPNFRRCVPQVTWQTSSSCQDWIESECEERQVDVGDTYSILQSQVVCNSGKNKWNYPTKAEYCNSFNGRGDWDPMDPCCN